MRDLPELLSIYFKFDNGETIPYRLDNRASGNYRLTDIITDYTEKLPTEQVIKTWRKHLAWYKDAKLNLNYYSQLDNKLNFDYLKALRLKDNKLKNYVYQESLRVDKRLKALMSLKLEPNIYLDFLKRNANTEK